MKKHSLLKAIGIAFLVVVVLSWLIPTGSYSNGAFVKGETSPFGIFDFVRSPMVAFSQLSIIGVIFLVIGGLYGVLNKTGVYSRIVEGITKKVKGKEKVFLAVTIVLFSLLSALTGSMYVLFILVPFFVAIILLLGYDKLTALSSTVIALLVGRLASLYGTSVNNYINGYFNLGVHDEIWTKLILLVIVTFLLVMFVFKYAKKEKVAKVEKTEAKKTTKKASKKAEEKKEVVVAVKENKDIPLYEKNEEKKKSALPFIIISILAIVVMFVATFDWSGTFGISFFTDLYDQILDLEILGYPLFKNILGNFTAFGEWTNYDLSIFLVFVSILIGWIYSVKLEEMIDGFVSGVKKMLPVAVYALLSCAVFAAVASTQNGIFTTISHWLLNLTEGFNLLTTSVVSFLSGLFYNDFQYAVYNVATPIQAAVTNSSFYPLAGVILQTMNGLAMLVLPTSVALVAGLAYLNVSFKEWFLHAWKYLLQVLVVIVLIFIIIGIFI